MRETYVLTRQSPRLFSNLKFVIFPGNPKSYTFIRFVAVSVTFGTCTALDLNGTLVEAKKFT
jgi:hypothetical protein